MELDYLHKDGYQVPDLTLSTKQPIGKYGLMRLEYLKGNRPSLYDMLLVTDSLNRHLAEVDRAAREQVDTTTNAMLKTEQGPCQLAQPLEWAKWMNGIKHRVEEQVIQEVLYNG